MLWLVVEHNLSEIEKNINFFPDKGRILAGICCEECKKKVQNKAIWEQVRNISPKHVCTGYKRAF
jgi:hypothetical protein